MITPKACNVGSPECGALGSVGRGLHFRKHSTPQGIPKLGGSVLGSPSHQERKWRAPSSNLAACSGELPAP